MQLAESGIIQDCFISELKKTTLKELDDEDNKTLLNKYLNLLVDCALSGKTTDFGIQFRMELIDNYVHLDIYNKDNINDFCFIGKFDLSKPFDQSYVLDFLGDENLILSGDSRNSKLVDFIKTRVLFTSDSFNTRLSEYLNFIADDLLYMEKDSKIYYRIIAADDHFELKMCNGYPFLNQNISFDINIEENFNSFKVVDHLNALTNSQLKDPQANFFVLINDGLQFLETIKILENVLDFDNQLTNIYYNNSIFTPINEISFLKIKHQKRDLSLEMMSKGELELQININRHNLSFVFGKKDSISESFTWLRTNCIDYDTTMIRQFFIIYLEKWLGYKITDLKREIQLIEMESI